MTRIAAAGRGTGRLGRWILVLVAALAGCGRGGCSGAPREPGGAAGGAPRRGGTVVVAIPTEPRTLMPYAAQTAWASVVQSACFMYLLETQPDLQTFGPELARSWEWGPDARTLTIHLRPEARWSDGVPVTAEDARFSFEIARDSTIGWGARPWKRDIEACDVVDEHTVRYRFGRVPREAVRFAKEGFVLPAHLLRDVPRDRWAEAEFGRHPVGCGPFRFERWDAGQQLVFVRNESYWDPQVPRLDRVVFRVVPDPDTRLRLLRAGEVDVVTELTPRDVRGLGPDSGTRVVHAPGRDYEYIAYNLEDPLFRSARVREALTRALDRPALVRALVGDFGEPLEGPVVPALWAYDPGVPRIPCDPDGARRLLAAEGWRDTDGDGWLDRDGRRFAFDLQLAGDHELRREFAVPIQGAWKAIGVEARLRPQERSAVLQARLDGTYQAVLGGWGINLALELGPVWGSRNVPRWNFVRYVNPRVDSLIDAASYMPPEAARPLLSELQRTIARDQPYTFLYAAHTIVGTRDRLQNVIVDARGEFNNMQTWWVTDATAPR